MRLALVSAAGVDIQTIDDRWLLATARDRGLDATVVRWDDPSVDWPAFDAVWLRSCWDYHLRYAEFTAWLRRADAAGTRFVNAADIVLRNSHKRYLLRLQQDGIPVAPLRLVPQGDPFDTARFLADIEAGTGAEGAWPDVVIKPAVSASAYRTWRASTLPREESAARVADMLADGDVILQRFVPEIGTHGEWSVIFFDGGFSHAVRRLPPAGEFRSQLEFGATLAVATPSTPMLATAHTALLSLCDGHAPCVARLDLVETAAGPVVMEVELIEPVLYFGQVPGAATHALDCIVRRAAARTQITAAMR
jgi:glutathione synthase/RimK-type ligase-like ATP-grasp enzyme